VSQEPYYLFAYGIYLLLTHVPLIGALLLLSISCCCGRMLCPRGNVRPLNPKESVLTCYGLCDPMGGVTKAHKPHELRSVPAVVYSQHSRVPRAGNDFDEQEEKVGFLL
jgi:hypothetical protein